MFLRLFVVNEEHGQGRGISTGFLATKQPSSFPHKCISVIVYLSICCTTKFIIAHSAASPQFNSEIIAGNSEAQQVTFILTEEAQTGTTIGNVLQSLRNTNSLANRFDSNGPVQLLELTSNRYLSLNATTGDLFVKSRIDRESLCREVGTCCTATLHTNRGLDDNSNRLRPQFQTVHNSKSPQPVFVNCFLRMLVLQNPNSDQFVEIVVYIVDVNDNAPRWSQQILDLEIPEHVPIGSVYKLPEANDPDQGPVNTVVAYHLYPATYNSQTSQVMCLQCPGRDVISAYGNLSPNPSQTPNMFTLDSQLIDGSHFAEYRFNLNLRVENDLDREKQSTHYLVLHAVDGLDEFDQQQQQTWSSHVGDFPYRTRHTGTLTIKITVLDTNDQVPVFVDSKPTVTVAENTKPGTVIYQAVARDADLVDKNSLIYKISTSATTEVHRCFAINQSTGEVYIRNRLYFPNATLLTDNNRHPSAHSSGNLPLSMGYVIPLQVSDRIHQAEAILTVQLTQVNSQPPKISLSSHLRMSAAGDQLWISEDTPAESIVAMINVNDPDKPLPMEGSDENLLGPGGLHYSTASASTNRPQCFTNHDHFVIRPLLASTASEFKLILRKQLDREVADSHSLRIECWDAGSPPLSSDIRFFVRVEDVDDSAPKFEKPIYSVNIKEGLPPHTLITRVQATDADVGRNADVVYRIANVVYIQAGDSSIKSEPTFIPFSEEKSIVSINRKTGEIYNELIFDRETLASINCTIEAFSPHAELEQVHVASGRTRFAFKAHAYVVINIEDVNDCAPQFNMTAYEFSVLEGQQPHHQIGRIFAVDHDAQAPNNLIRYSMRPIPGPIGQLAKLYLTISSDGILYTQQSQLDREQTPVLSFEVVATDNGRPSMSAFANVLVRVLDANDNSPVWLFPKQYGSRATVNISQQATVGFQLAQLKAIDMDEGANGEVIYSILHGNEDGFFEVDPLNGALYLTKSLYLFAQNESKLLPASPVPVVQTNTSRDQEEKRAGHLHTMGPNNSKAQFYQHRLILKASDRGQPPRFNTTVLDILIFSSDFSVDGTDADMRGNRGGINNNRYGAVSAHEFGRILDQDLVIMVVLIALTSVISIILILAICLIRCRQLTGPRRAQHNVLCGPNQCNGASKPCVIPDSDKPHWWKQSLAFFNRRQKQSPTIGQTEVCNRTSAQDLYVLSSTVCEEDLQQSDQLTAQPGQNTPGPDAYFTICPGTWNSRIGPKGMCSTILDPETYLALANTPDKMSNTYVVELNPAAFDQPYAFIKPQPCTSSNHEDVHYQALYSDRVNLKPSPSRVNTCSLKQNCPSESVRRKTGNRTTDVEMQPMEAEQLLIPHLNPAEQRSPCQTCDRQILQTFLSKTSPVKPIERVQNEDDMDDELEC